MIVNRRELFVTAGAVLAAGTARAADMPMDHDHMHMMHGSGANPLIDAASNCVKAGQACTAHCLSLFLSGDVSTAACVKSVDEAQAICVALQKLAAAGSSQLPAMAKIAHASCQACETECRKHEQHAECKACADACKACAEECRKVMG